MHLLLTVSLATLVVCQGSALSAEGGSEEMEQFLAWDWGFESHLCDGRQVVRAVWARHVEEPRERRFLNSLGGLERLHVEASTLAPDNIRSLVSSFPSLTALHFARRGARPALEADIWPALFEFRKLKHLSVANLRFSGAENWVARHRTDLDTLMVSGNLRGRLPALLAFCNVRSLRIELLASRQHLTAADYAALDSHPEIESLEIAGDLFGGGISVDLSALSQLRRLKRLTLRQCSVDPLDLHRFPVLRALNLETCRFMNHGFDAVLTHPALEELLLRECKTNELRIAGPYVGPPKTLRTITLRFPVFDEIKAFRGLSCSYNVELGSAGLCTPTAKAHSLWWIGRDEIASLGQLKELRRVSISGLVAGDVKVSAAALVQLARIETLRSLEVREADLVQDPLPGSSGQGRGLEEVRFVTNTPLSRQFFAGFLGANTRSVLIGDYSEKAKTGKQWSHATPYRPKKVALVCATLPLSRSSLKRHLLTPSTEDLVLTFCQLNKGAIQQLVARSPSLKRITLEICSVEDERELLQLNDLAGLKWVDFGQTDVSASTALGMKVESVRVGETWRTDR